MHLRNYAFVCCQKVRLVGTEDRLMVLLLYNTGARVSELVNLKYGDIVLDGSGSAGYARIVGKV